MPEPLPNTDYIAFADDITQITSGRYKYRDAARNTEHAIRQINEFENKWKIKTNRSKFQIIPISRKNTADIYLNDNEILQYTNEGKILGLTFNRGGIHPQIKIRTAVALNNLSKLHRFKSLNIKNKLKLYNALIRSTLIYPPVILNTIAKSPMLKLQRVQNKALKYSTNTRWDEFRTIDSLHQQTNTLPINIIIHQQAKSTWQNIRINLPNIYETLQENNPPEIVNSRFPSSRRAAERPQPLPIYR